MKALLTIILLLILGSGVAQDIRKYRTETFASRQYNTYQNEWEEWGDWEPSEDILIVFNVKIKQIVIYTERHQEYDITYVGEVEERSSDSKSLNLSAVDEEGIPCDIEIIKFDTGKTHFYIRWSNLQLVYQATRI